MHSNIPKSILKELTRRALSKQALKDLHPGQQEFLGLTSSSPPIYSAALLPRRQGKSRGALQYGAYLCSTKPRANVLYIARTGKQATQLASEHLTLPNTQYNWKAHYRRTEGAWYFPATSSWLYVAGADHDRFFEQWRGYAWDLVIIDEAQSMTHVDLERFVHEVVGPALPERNGRFIMVGTPGYEPRGYYYEVCETSLHSRYTVYHTDPNDPHKNPYTKKFLEEEIKIQKDISSDVVNEAWFQREFYGRWVADNRKNVIQLDSRNYTTTWKPTPQTQYILGIDFGYVDPNAFVIAAYEPLSPVITYLEAYEQTEMLLHETAEKIQSYMGKYPRLRIVADPGGNSKALWEEFRRTYGLPLEVAKKPEKRAHTERLNSEARRGLIKIYHPTHPEAHPLSKQWNQLTWVETSHGKEEGHPRHIHDAALYARRGADLYEAPVVPELTMGERMKRGALERSKPSRRGW